MKQLGVIMKKDLRINFDRGSSLSHQCIFLSSVTVQNSDNFRSNAAINKMER